MIRHATLIRGAAGQHSRLPGVCRASRPGAGRRKSEMEENERRRDTLGKRKSSWMSARVPYAGKIERSKALEAYNTHIIGEVHVAMSKRGIFIARVSHLQRSNIRGIFDAAYLCVSYLQLHQQMA